MNPAGSRWDPCHSQLRSSAEALRRYMFLAELVDLVFSEGSQADGTGIKISLRASNARERRGSIFKPLQACRHWWLLMSRHAETARG